MYELSRVLLKSVGPTGARYQDVLLDLSGVGRPVAGNQMLLFGSGAPARRPSPATVLFLENGGGKSVLIKLIFSVVLPGQRQAVGSSSGGTLGRFVLDGDTSHIVLEWTHVHSGRRLITGKVSEWKDLRASTDSRNLIERWYHFRPTANLGLENLPTSDESRYLRLNAYLEELKCAGADSSMEYASFERHGEWTERLTELGLDPELFRYQRSMNADEGEAAEAFSFTSDTAFVTFLLNAVLPTGPARDLADLLETYAGRIGQRNQLVLEQDFVAGSLDILTALAAARSTAEGMRKRQQEAARSTAVLLRRLRARAEAEASSASALKTEASELASDLGNTRKQHAVLSSITTELERLVAGLRLAEAHADSTRADLAAATVSADLRAWQLTPLVLRRLTAEEHLQRTRAVVEAAEQAARPALLARDHSAVVLAAALGHMAGDLVQQAKSAEEDATNAGEEAAAAQKAHDAAVLRAARSHSAAEEHDKRVLEVRAAIVAAMETGLLVEGSSAADGVARAEEAAERNRQTLSVLEAEIAQLEGVKKQEATALGIRRQQLANSVRALDSAAEAWRSAEDRTEALRTDSGFVELLGHSAGALDTSAEILITSLTEVHDRAVAEITELRVTGAQDDRNRAALESTELLPSSPEAIRLKNVLVEAGITAWTGWEYLAAVPDLDRRRLLSQQVPQLTAGVLLNNPNHLDQARQLIDECKLRPTSFLPVGTTAAMEVEHPPLSGVDFVVPPHPALYDEQVASAELRELQRQQTRRQQQLADHAARRDAAAALMSRVREWRREFPQGRLDQLEARHVELTRTASEAAQALEDLTSRAEETEEKLVSARTAVKPLRTAQPALDSKALLLHALAEREATIPGLRDSAARDREAAEQQEMVARTAGELAEQCRVLKADSVRKADAHRALASRLGEEAAELPEADLDTLERPTEALEVLRRSYASAKEAYQRASVGDSLLADLRHAEAEMAELTRELVSHPTAAAIRAEELLNSPAGADQGSREAAWRICTLAEPELAKSAAESAAQLANRTEEYQRYSEPEEPVDLAPFETPRHITHGLRQIDEAKKRRDELASAVGYLEEHQARLEHTMRAALSAHDSFAKFDLDWPDFRHAEPAELIEAEPFGENLEVARSQHRTAIASHDEAKKHAAAAQADERKHADALAAHAGQGRFLALGTASHQIILSTERDKLPQHASEWADAMRSRLRSLSDDLSTIESHRAQIVNQFSQQVSDALRILTRAERYSKLPKGLGEWSGQKFLRIRFKAPDPDELPGRMGVLVDELAEEAVQAAAAGRELRRSGISMVLKGVVSAAAPGGFTVSILKPDATLRTERVPVAQLRTVFSGGQTLTTAIILYCTMAALRANDRGRLGNRHSGTLFLDNPIGRASATYLLRLQQAVARALGVQLIFTTGLFDTTALDVFPLVVRLRNDSDLRAKRKYLSVSQVFGHYLDDDLTRYPGQPSITATRYFTKDDNDSELG